MMILHPLHQHLLLMPTLLYFSVTHFMFHISDIPELSPCFLKILLVQGFLFIYFVSVSRNLRNNVVTLASSYFQGFLKLNKFCRNNS